MSMETYSPSSFDTESEMLPQDPPPKVIRFMGWWLISLFVVVLLAAIFVHLPETEHAAFVLIPREGADPIQSPRLATVSRVSVTEGQTDPGIRHAAANPNGRLAYAGIDPGENGRSLRCRSKH